MKKPFYIKLPETIDAEHKHLTQQCKYPLTFAKKHQYFKKRNLEIISQQLNYRPFYVDLLEARITGETSFPFVVDNRHLYLSFMLEGKFFFTTDDQQPIMTAHQKSFMIAIYDKGVYHVQASPGREEYERSATM